MRWSYKYHWFLNSIIKQIYGLCDFIMVLSWHYAHYKNGNGPKSAVNGSFIKVVAWAWKYRHEE